MSDTSLENLGGPAQGSSDTTPRRTGYAFLRRPRWVGTAALAVALTLVMVGLGFWQFSRYQERDAVNDRIDAAGVTDPVPVGDVLTVETAPDDDVAWVRVTATGTYDPVSEILVRSRTVSDRVGYEVLTPLVLADGTALLVDRGWIPPAAEGAADLPEVPAAPEGEVTVVGRVHLPESGGSRAETRRGRLEVRRIDPTLLTADLPYPVYGGYLLLDTQRPPVSGDLVPVPVDRVDAGQNLSYMVQWWLFAAATVVGFGWLVRREAGRSRDG